MLFDHSEDSEKKEIVTKAQNWIRDVALPAEVEARKSYPIISLWKQNNTRISQLKAKLETPPSQEDMQKDEKCADEYKKNVAELESLEQNFQEQTKLFNEILEKTSWPQLLKEGTIDLPKEKEVRDHLRKFFAGAPKLAGFQPSLLRRTGC